MTLTDILNTFDMKPYRVSGSEHIWLGKEDYVQLQADDDKDFARLWVPDGHIYIDFGVIKPRSVYTRPILNEKEVMDFIHVIQVELELRGAT